MMKPVTLEHGYFARLVNGPPFTPGEDLKFELLRLKTFEHWNHYDKAHPIKLAKAGFVYTGQNTLVRCFVCRSSKHDWNWSLDPMIEHMKLNSECPFVRNVDNINISVCIPDEENYKRINDSLHQQYCVSNGHGETRDSTSMAPYISEPPTSAGRELAGELAATASVSNMADGRHYPILASDSASAGTTQQAIGNYSSRDNETAPIREEFAHFKAETARFATFDTWPSTARADPRDLARTGFIYTKIADRVQCVFCRGILRNWTEEDDPAEEHLEHFPHCPFISGENVGNIPDVHLTEGNEFVNVISDVTLGIVTDRPRHPNYAVEAVRLNSFVNWPSTKEQTPKMLAKAGFFYAGIGDSVKCFFCDGGLRTWEPGDDPWREHARWFPKCPYVRQVKGPEFIDSSKRNSSVSASAANSKNDNKKNRTLGSKVGKQTSTKRKECTVDPRDVSARMDRPIVRTVLQMGISRDAVQKTIERHLRETGDDFSSAEALLEAVFANESNENNDRENTTCASKAEVTASSCEAEMSSEGTGGTGELLQMEDEPIASNEDTESLMEENRQLKEQRQCRICMDAEVNVVFLPCGHLVCCTTCAPAMRKCPICRGNIRGTVRTFLS